MEGYEMTLQIRFNEIIEEITEDLELQSGLVLSESQIYNLKTDKYITFKESELKPYLNDITEYLNKTEPSERVWDCYKTLSDNTYIIFIKIENAYIKLIPLN